MNKKNTLTIVYGLIPNEKKEIELARFSSPKQAYDSVRISQVYSKHSKTYSYKKNSPYCGFRTIRIAPIMSWMDG